MPLLKHTTHRIETEVQKHLTLVTMLHDLEHQYEIAVHDPKLAGESAEDIEERLEKCKTLLNESLERVARDFHTVLVRLQHDTAREFYEEKHREYMRDKEAWERLLETTVDPGLKRVMRERLEAVDSLLSITYPHTVREKAEAHADAAHAHMAHT